MKVVYVSGYWATNIGNAFFNLGADYVLKKVFGEANVNAIFDQPAGIIRSQKRKGNPKKSLPLIEHVEADMFVLLGPVLSRDFLKIWSKTIISLKNRGKKYAILSCGFMKCDPRFLTEIRAFLKEYPPIVITTRDSDAYGKLLNLGIDIYDGVDFAFFLPETHSPLKLDFPNLLTLNFDKFFEPKIIISNQLIPKYNFVFNEQYWKLDFNGFIKRIGAKTDRISDALVYALSVFPAKDRQVKVDQYDIIRTDHRFSPMLKNKVFRYSNSFVSDVPQSYVDIYANSKLTLSDRVHACVATLAYGNYAMLFSKTKRSKLLDRVGANDIYSYPVRIDLAKLKTEKESLIEWLQKQLR